MSKEFEIGRKRALAEIERKMAIALRARKGQDTTTTEPGATPGVLDRTPAERLGLQNAKQKLSDTAMTPEADERQPFMNSLALAKVLRPFDPAVRASGRELLDASRHNRARAMARLGFKVD